jgi:hypothetical protein
MRKQKVSKAKPSVPKCMICRKPIKKAVIGKDNIKFDSKKCADYHNMNYPSDLFTAIAMGRF